MKLVGGQPVSTLSYQVKPWVPDTVDGHARIVPDQGGSHADRGNRHNPLMVYQVAVVQNM